MSCRAGPTTRAASCGASRRGRRGSAAARRAQRRATPTPTSPSRSRKSTSDLTVTDAADNVLFYAPVTTGSEHDPLPIGEWKVTGVQHNPTFHYNPDLFWDADPTHTKATIPAGPNNPGRRRLDRHLARPHYGLHGTPEPSTIGKTQSHGCVRLTNWDALRARGAGASRAHASCSRNSDDSGQARR